MKNYLNFVIRLYVWRVFRFVGVAFTSPKTLMLNFHGMDVGQHMLLANGIVNLTLIYSINWI